MLGLGKIYAGNFMTLLLRRLMSNLRCIYVCTSFLKIAEQLNFEKGA